MCFFETKAFTCGSGLLCISRRFRFASKLSDVVEKEPFLAGLELLDESRKQISIYRAQVENVRALNSTVSDVRRVKRKRRALAHTNRMPFRCQSIDAPI